MADRNGQNDRSDEVVALNRIGDILSDIERHLARISNTLDETNEKLVKPGGRE